MVEPGWTHTLERGGEPLFAAGAGAIAFPGPEWLLTDGRGGYAMGTASGCRTRRYHGLRVLALDPPLARALLLADTLDAVTSPAGEVFELSTLAFADHAGERVLAPAGWERLVRFERAPAAVRWTFALAGGARLRRTLTLDRGAEGADVAFELTGTEPSGWHLRVAPLIAWRDHHALTGEGGAAIHCACEDGARLVRLGGDLPAGPAEATLSLPTGRFRRDSDWWRGVRLAADAERGQADAEDLFVPGSFEADLLGPRVLRLRRTPADDAPPRPRPGVGVSGDPLAPAAADFLAARRVGAETLTTVLAGYPWFADWGRDAFIALPGLLLVDRRLGEAAGVLRAFAGALRGGLVPNRFSDAGGDAAEYNTLDGSMWFVHAALAWAEAATAAGAACLPPWWERAVVAVLDAHLAGTVADGHRGEAIAVEVGGDGLIVAGGADTQLTWMDAACPTPAHPGGEVFTPRGGKPVEVNALWVSNLAGAAAVLPGGERYAAAAQHAAASFLATFWSDGLGRLVDRVSAAGEADATLRPNMLIAAALERSPLSAAQRSAVVAAAEAGGLVTPVGLRTLPPSDPAYHPRMAGAPHERDGAYHRGTIWPWLIGPYAEAVLRAGGFSAAARAKAAAAVAPLRAYAGASDAACLGQLPENFDAEPDAGGRWVPRGCPAQAWSVAEVRRVAALLSRR
ncbi:amylo-alpha-1,6-glucosidase [Phycisphaera mikurensis]|uniref:Amylo-alpha-1,6-glucosidase family protein n=1 Tax=Phycisphaera mikurensis (strain NBRC 102666 / KCTC 22515 / FYK2301M01) TaxID=1142394 RepID=I0IAK8_PHYMF|nr:amylo-alpha-1,6-glucosidase [Phycisphaera mikurensis]MBB6441708.1 glycogen debranching enzyme [Phycisphaera mikurensis]BAM02296.1 amylo-alpha-1,6-glucosidase family protein [Phycisphaera mikurensis NBRC 102666]